MTAHTCTPVRYGAHVDQVAEVTLPDRHDGRARLILLFHGGFWRAAHDRAHVRPLAAALAGQGWAVANVEYRRVAAGGGWPATFHDVARAVDALPPRIERLFPGRTDPGAVVYAGHSAGGHLALWAALRHRLPPGTPGRSRRPPSVAGVLALAPVVDLAGSLRRGEGGTAVAALLGGGPDRRPQRYAGTDPSTLGAPRATTVIVHGDRDDVLPLTSVLAYRAANPTVRLRVPPGAGHFDVIDPGSAAWPTVAGALASITAGAVGRSDGPTHPPFVRCRRP
jgi:acetyl esterase/lipase